MASKTFNVGIVGYAFSAKAFHIPFIALVPSLKIYAFVQRHPKPDNDAGKDFPGTIVYRSIEELVRDKNVDLVVITTPPSSHFELTKLALEHGKNVVVEKPFVPTYHEAQELISLAASNKCLLTVYQNRRWDADFLTVSDLIAKGTVGRIVEFETHFDRFRPKPSAGGWKATPGPGTGAIYDLGTHLIDQVITLFGFPKSVTGFMVNQRDDGSGFEDSCTVLLHYGGLLTTVKTAVISPEQDQLRFWIRGTKGSYKKYHPDCQEEQLKAGRQPDEEGFGVEVQSRHGILSLVDGDTITSRPYPTVEPATWTAYYLQVAKALAGQGEMPVKPEIAAAVIRLIELARQSSKEGRTLDYNACAANYEDSWHPRHAAAFVRWASVQPGRHVLELACGAGLITIPIAKILSDHVAQSQARGSVTSVDVAEDMMAVARANAQRAGLSRAIELIWHDITRLDTLPQGALREESYDFITFTACVHLLENTGEAIKHWALYLALGGRLVIDIPGVDSRHARLIYEDTIRELGAGGRLPGSRGWIKDQSTLENLVVAAVTVEEGGKVFDGWFRGPMSSGLRGIGDEFRVKARELFVEK